MNWSTKTAMVSTSVAALAAPSEQGAATMPNVPGAMAVPKFDGNAMAELAKTMAAKVSDDTEEVLSGIMKAKEEGVSGTVNLMVRLQADYGDELDSMPRPDSDTGNVRDVFEIEVTDNGKTTKKEATFWNIFADNTPLGKEIITELAEVKRALNTNANQSGIRDEVSNMNPQELTVREAYLSGRKATNRNAIKKAASLYFQFCDVKALPYVDAAPAWEGEAGGPVMATAKPILVWQPNGDKPPVKWAYFGIGAFLKLKPRVAAEKGGNYDALVATGKKGTNAESGDNGHTIKTIETGVKTLVEIHRWMDEIENDKNSAEIGKLMKVINHKDADELAVAIVELSNYLNDLRKGCGLDARYVKLQQSGSDLVAKAA